MISTTFEGESVYLLPYRANWKTPPVWRASLQTEANQSLKGNESRRAFAFALLSEVEFTATLIGAQAADMRVGIQRLKNSRVLCPFWPSKHDASAVSDPAATTGIWLIAEQDLSSYEVNTTGTASGFTPSASAFRVPLMLGVFKSDPVPATETSVISNWKIIFREAGPATYALMPTGTDGADGTTLPTGVTPKVFPFMPSWQRRPEAGGASVQLDRSSVGFGREPLEVFYPQESARGLTLGFTRTTSAELARLVYFFLLRQGSVSPFWLPGALDECTLTAPTDGVSAVVHVDRVANIGDNVWLAFFNTSTRFLSVRKVISKNVGAGTITLDTAPAVFLPSSTRVLSAVLAKFKKSEISITYTTDTVGDAQISFTEIPQEYATQSGETTGTTIGGLARKAFLYRFTREYPGGTITDLFTNYERSVTVGGTEVFDKDTTTIIAHSDVVDSLEPDKITVGITSRAFSGNPLLLLLPNQLEGPLYLEILECNPDEDGAADEATSIFLGKVRKPSFSGPKITAEAVHVLSDLGRNVPTFSIQPTCNYRLFGPSCGLEEADFTDDLVVSAISGNTVTVATGTARAAGYFAFGRVWIGSGATYQARSIYDSTATAGGHVTLTIDTPFRSPVTVGNTVKVSPGCDKLGTTCLAKFSNYQRFGGAPFTPPGNPSLVKIVQNETGGGKKG